MRSCNKLGPVNPYLILNVHVYLLVTNKGYLLVDCGIPGFEDRLTAAFKFWNIDPRLVTHIILTHGHLDHIGCLAYAKMITGAKIICQESITDQLAAGSFEKAEARVLYWKLLNTPLSRLLATRLEPIMPDLDFELELDIGPIGIPGRLIHTPGHSPGSCSILLKSGEAIIGDLVRKNRKGVIDTGLFHTDRKLILDSLRKILKDNPQSFYLSHGGVVSREELEAFMISNLRPSRDISPFH
jgi:glyoxylase-like metal-dependent hydrolase (beta-lactamase superfamily II)